MPIAWYIVPWARVYRGDGIPRRQCALCKYNKQIWAAGGKWTCFEVLGNRLIVKIKAPAAILTMMDSKYKRLPKDILDDSLSDLSAGVRTALKNDILDMGYTIDEIRAKFGSNLGQYTLRDVLKFMAARRRKPRYDPDTDEIVCDGDVRGCRITIENIDNRIQ